MRASKRQSKRSLAATPGGGEGGGGGGGGGGGVVAEGGKRKKKRAADDFVDKQFYMEFYKEVDEEEKATKAADSYLRVNAGERGAKLDEATMDLVEDENGEASRKRHSVLKWDLKKKKYVRQVLGQTGIGATDGITDRGKKRLRDESGNFGQGANPHPHPKLYPNHKP